MNELLAGRNLLLGVSGSIAAYKAADMCSQLGKSGAEVHVVLTPNAAQFIGPATFRALTRNPVLIDTFDEPHARRIAHIELAQSADLVLVAPASANILAKLAHGLADNLLSTCLLATPPTTPLLLAPAMNTFMWQHPATMANLELLQARGLEILQPGYGLLACLEEGVGKLAEVADIVRAVVDRLNGTQDLRGRRLLVTAGATREPLDPVRFLSNRSSGKMGYAIAQEAARRGAEVTLVSGFATAPIPRNVEVVHVDSADEMLAACESHFSACDILIAAAAVADYAAETVASQKIKKPPLPSDLERTPPGKKITLRVMSDLPADSEGTPVPEGGDDLILRLRRTPDILATLSAAKQSHQLVVGFAAETENLLANASRKLASKHLDLLVANDVTQEGAGFEGDTNIVTLLWPDGRIESLPQLSKPAVARRLLDALQPLLPPVS